MELVKVDDSITEEQSNILNTESDKVQEDKVTTTVFVPIVKIQSNHPLFNKLSPETVRLLL